MEFSIQAVVSTLEIVRCTTKLYQQLFERDRRQNLQELSDITRILQRVHTELEVSSSASRVARDSQLRISLADTLLKCRDAVSFLCDKLEIYNFDYHTTPIARKTWHEFLGSTPQAKDALVNLRRFPPLLESFLDRRPRESPRHKLGKYLDRQSQDPFRGQIVLCLDGMGLRGSAILTVLRALVVEIAKQEFKYDKSVHDSYSSPLFQSTDRDPFGVERRSTAPDVRSIMLCHYFDYIGGSSTGGIVAIMLATMRCDIDEAILRTRAIWLDVLPVFSKAWFPVTDPVSKRRKSTEMTNRLDDALNGVNDQAKTAAGKTSFPGQARPLTTLKATPEMCQTIVFATYSPENGPVSHFAFRSYGTKVDNAVITAADACRAACALPKAFSKVRIKGLKGSFRDGTLSKANPAQDMYTEVRRHQLEQNSGQYLNGMLSIGSGLAEQTSPPARAHSGSSLDGKYPWHADEEPFVSSPSDEIDCMYDRLMCTTSSKPSASIADLLDDTEAEALEYCSKQEVKVTLELWAKTLVEIRQRRSRTVQWERYAGLIASDPSTTQTSADAFARTDSGWSLGSNFSRKGADFPLSRALRRRSMLRHG